MNKKYQIILAFLLSTLTLVFAYLSLGWLVMLIFATGYLGGFFLWLVFQNKCSFSVVKAPYWFTLAFFIFLHKPEEKYMKFFEVVSGITNLPVPSTYSFPVIMMLLVGAVPWLFIPILMKRNIPFGNYLAWTFFTSMGITELAHFLVFPFLVKNGYAYFPGMASVIFLAPVAWWGIYRLTQSKEGQV